MPKSFHAQILTPSGKLFDGEVTGVQLPGAEGRFEVLYGHAKIVSILDAGQVRIRVPGKEDRLFDVEGGVVEVEDNQLTLLAESAAVAAG
ncbi:MAG: ATP synthase F1 subunit epsilon [Balneolaceae bacterium]